VDKREARQKLTGLDGDAEPSPFFGDDGDEAELGLLLLVEN